MVAVPPRADQAAGDRADQRRAAQGDQRAGGGAENDAGADGQKLPLVDIAGRDRRFA
jgi:hypothetical protein